MPRVSPRKMAICGIVLLALLGAFFSPRTLKSWVPRRKSNVNTSQRPVVVEPLVVTESVSAQPLFPEGDADTLHSIPFKVPGTIEQRICRLGGFDTSPFDDLTMSFIGNAHGTVELALNGSSGPDLQVSGPLFSLHEGYHLEPIVRVDEPRADGRHLAGQVRLTKFDAKGSRNFDVDFDMLVHLKKGSALQSASVDPTGAEIRWTFQP